MKTEDNIYSLCDSHSKIEGAIKEMKQSPEWPQVQAEFNRMLSVIENVEYAQSYADVTALAVAAYIRIVNHWEDFHS